jgi:hypothetical protein
MRMSKIYAHVQNICAYLKYLRISKIPAPHKIYDSNKADVEISAPIKNICVHQKIGAQTLTIWARQNLQLLTSSKSGWGSSRSGDVVSPPCSPQVMWALKPPSLYGRHLSGTVPAVVPARLAKISASCPNICGRIYFHHFLGKNQKPNSAHKCPITSLQIRTWSQKLPESSYNTFEPLNRGHPRFWPRTLKTTQFQPWGGGGFVGEEEGRGFDKHHSACASLQYTQ